MVHLPSRLALVWGITPQQSALQNASGLLHEPGRAVVSLVSGRREKVVRHGHTSLAPQVSLFD
jgi:hypothetical protein